MVRPKKITTPQPTAMQFNIYVNEKRNLADAIKAASYGYNSIVAFPRGKYKSPDKIEPYKHETKDTHAVINWIVDQPWSDGRVGMYGGSYLGYTQWAATKKMHPALKTIVPYVAAIPGLGLPMENNIFINANYGWAFYVTNNKTLDDAVYSQRDRWRKLNEKWFLSGRPYKDYDTIDGTPNPLFQEWISHPSYDEYWQAMVPFKYEYAQINIPVLSITGYYDDGQISALHYLNEHEKYNKSANHFLVIGPYDHWTAQRKAEKTLRGYTLDPVAHIDTPDLTFEWFDYIFKGAAKPALLKGKINYQLMTDNSWRHAASMDELNSDTQRFYFKKKLSGEHFTLSKLAPSKTRSFDQVVDFSDRSKSTNTGYYPWPIIQDTVDISSGYSFLSMPLTEDMIISGQFSATLKVQINKKDMDVGLTLYEVTPDGKVFHLSYLLGRASYASDMTKRQLLTPDKTETIHLKRSRMIGKKISKDSRLLLVLDINKNAFAQVNHGTGKEVSLESTTDGQEPLKIKWFEGSYIDVPLRKIH